MGSVIGVGDVCCWIFAAVVMRGLCGWGGDGWMGCDGGVGPSLGTFLYLSLFLRWCRRCWYCSFRW